MEQWSGPQQGLAVKAYYQNGESVVRTQRAFRIHFAVPKNHPVPSGNVIRRWVNNMGEIGSTARRRGGSVKTMRTPKHVERVRQATGRSPRRSCRSHSTTLGIPCSSLHRVLHFDLHYHTYKIQVVQALNGADYPIRKNFCEQMLGFINENPEILNNLWMSDEAHFHLSG
jgi:hypothetical protein